jgi:hypothetical protein
MKFSLVHPSRGRPDQAMGVVDEWKRSSSGAHVIEHILSVDDDDPDAARYETLASTAGVSLVNGPNRSLVEAANRGATQATGDALIVVSDDFGCPERWDEKLAEVFADRLDLAILVDDGLGARIMTLPILGRGLYERLGYVYHPSYHGQFVDDDLTQTARALGLLVDAKHLLFPHRHFTAGQSRIDLTYLRHNRPGRWWSGWRTFEKRRLQGFGVSEPSPEAAKQAARIDLYVRVRVAGSIVRRLWLKRLPRRLVDWEYGLRTRALRFLERLLKLSAPV